MNDRRTPLDALALGVATLLGAGKSPVIPGTAGTLASLPLALLAAAFLPLPAYVVLTLFVSLVGVWAAGRVSAALGIKDPGVVVIDETAGLFVTFLAIPVSWTAAALGFFCFRAMDIFKPPPARQAEALPSGWGIMLDDLMAGVYANLLVRIGLFLVSTVTTLR
ncbi:MAG TPA: phosphatidylglycerophosphatase A [Candidatus Polarisedimenticolia bacterium]|jgi:phosphatidylglycerophosphatase A|nr:phosphatidylglycerophosphatase A [Candidatus Polarisedimenticolia bacterium]